MYEYINGTVKRVGPEYVVLENAGIGYQIFTSNPFLFSKYENQEKTIYTYQHVREDILALYGFLTMEEKLLFIKLLNVSGIGPKGALAILASGAPEQVISAIEGEDEGFLTKFPGVGKKTARQMILDLKGKLQDVVPDYFPNLFNEGKHEAVSNNDELIEEAALALKALGYSEREIKKVTPKLTSQGKTTDELIKDALKLLLK
ncbi:Holliday junction branch migration protein RuvA [Rossellomorea vietnamensis]|uniref:Holliday junction branch migration complex subunit RuvA n=2 Tax=Rossellomorea TaxID=2837508 RepID=A0A5D4P0L9_9BACI|nr:MULTISPECIES: Holliday junction branch migration protein RuvA [Rossellomorea]TYR76807.1 Holliday junction branch migration protein RuvA [Rossellomorea vietnamensis]TYS19599.1 Holliday junction branch migration protein RuvA [Rossellomorea vietnamensis]TYS84018.1 Holliday junction branch migration protein RuvA [Rossellomorea aquimaris]